MALSDDEPAPLSERTGTGGVASCLRRRLLSPTWISASFTPTCSSAPRCPVVQGTVSRCRRPPLVGEATVPASATRTSCRPATRFLDRNPGGGRCRWRSLTATSRKSTRIRADALRPPRSPARRAPIPPHLDGSHHGEGGSFSRSIGDCVLRELTAGLLRGATGQQGGWRRDGRWPEAQPGWPHYPSASACTRARAYMCSVRAQRGSFRDVVGFSA